MNDPQVAAPKTIGMFAIDLDKRRAEFEAQHGKGVEHEFQQLGKELEPIYGKDQTWLIFSLPGVTEAKVRKAHQICQRKKPGNYAYFRGVLNNL